MSKKQNKLITKEILNNAIKKGTFLKFDPRLMVNIKPLYKSKSFDT